METPVLRLRKKTAYPTSVEHQLIPGPKSGPEGLDVAEELPAVLDLEVLANSRHDVLEGVRGRLLHVGAL